MSKISRIVTTLAFIIVIAACDGGNSPDKTEKKTSDMIELPESASVYNDDNASDADNEQADVNNNPEQNNDGIDVDLTVLSSTMVYSEVFCMLSEPEKYIGKTVKMEGLFVSSHDDSTDKNYYACIIQDATACCSQGIEFVLTDDYVYPDDYPKDNDEICVTGEFSSYMEDDKTYYTLKNARLCEK